MIHRGEQLVAQDVISEREGFKAQWQQRLSLHDGRDVLTTELCRDIDELHWRKREHAEKAQGKPVGVHALRPTSRARSSAPWAVWLVSAIWPEVTCPSMIGASKTRSSRMKAMWLWRCAAVKSAHAVADAESSVRFTS